MAEVIDNEVQIGDQILEQLRCSLCKGYLSYAPIQLLPDGRSICGRCSLSNSDQQTYRQITLETIIGKVLFPCQFKKFGCEERLLFGSTNEHEDKCVFRSFVCPLSSSRTCSWEGSVVQMPEHFIKEHTDLVKEKLEFKLQVDKDDQGILMVVFDELPLIMKYKFNASTSDLHYDIRIISFNIQEALFKIRLINAFDRDYSSTLKGGKCLPFNNQFYSPQGCRALLVNNFLQNLDNPTCIRVAIPLSVTKSNKIVSEEQLTVDYDLIQSLRCKRCQGYLIPPLFDSLNGVVCWYCCDKFGASEPLQNYELKECVAKATFPCRWRNCEFVAKSGNIREHQLICPFRIFKCADCKNTFTWKEAVAHLQSHGYEYFTDTFIYKMLFAKQSPRKKIFTFKNNEIVFIMYQTAHYNKYRHELDMYLIDSYSSNIAVKVEFEHAHCKIKSEIFTVTESKGGDFTINHLPPCFKGDEELTVTLKI